MDTHKKGALAGTLSATSQLNSTIAKPGKLKNVLQYEEESRSGI